jgi:hypothetical protein
MEDIFKVLAENKEICRALMGDNGDASFIFKMEDIIEENAKKQLEELFPDIKDNLQYILSFCLSGCMGIVNQWLFQNGQETPEEMAKLMFKMVVHALGIQKYEDLLQS